MPRAGTVSASMRSHCSGIGSANWLVIPVILLRKFQRLLDGPEPVWRQRSELELGEDHRALLRLADEQLLAQHRDLTLAQYEWRAGRERSLAFTGRTKLRIHLSGDAGN